MIGNGLQRLDTSTEAILLGLIEENALPLSTVQCEIERCSDSGIGHYQASQQRVETYNISYSLMMCKLCGNLPDSENNRDYCPAKMRKLAKRWLNP